MLCIKNLHEMTEANTRLDAYDYPVCKQCARAYQIQYRAKKNAVATAADPNGPHVKRAPFSIDGLCGATGPHVRFVSVGRRSNCPACIEAYNMKRERGKARFDAKRASAT